MATATWDQRVEEEIEESEILMLLETGEDTQSLIPSLAGGGGQVEEQSYHQLTDRTHRLEQERRQLLDELANLKESTLYSKQADGEELLAQTNEIYEKYTSEVRVLKGELRQIELEKESTEKENVYLKTRVQLIDEQKELISKEFENYKDKSKDEMKKLQEKVMEYEGMELKVAKSERRIKYLERKLTENEDDQHLITASKQRLMTCHELEQEHRLLSLENETLRERADNVDLLTYQLQSLREKCSSLESERASHQQLLTDNQVLREQLETAVGGAETAVSPLMSPSLMRLQLIQLQQKEVILTTNIAELKTQLTITENTLEEANGTIEQLKRQLSRQEVELASRSEAIQRLKRKVEFITKDRDGCINVLNSYKLDSGANSILTEQVTQLEANNTRLNQTLVEYATELEKCHAELEREKLARLAAD